MRRFSGHAQPHSGATQSCSAPGLRRCGLVDLVGVDAAVDPAAARRRAVVARGPGRSTAPCRRRPMPLISRSTASASGSSCEPCRRVVPREVEHRPVLAGPSSRRACSRTRRPRWYMNHRSERAVARRLDRLVAPLQQPLGVGERAVLLGVGGGGQQEHLGADVLRAHLARLDLRRVVPERRRLGLDEVAHHEPLELAPSPRAAAPPLAEPTAGFSPITK